MTFSATYPIRTELVQKSSDIHSNSCRHLEKIECDPSTLIVLLISLYQSHYCILDSLFSVVGFFFAQPAKLSHSAFA